MRLVRPQPFSVAFAVDRRAVVSSPGRKQAQSDLKSTTRRALLASLVLLGVLEHDVSC